MIPLWLPILLALALAYGQFVTAALRVPRRHARVLPRPRPHRVFMTGRHVRAYEARHTIGNHA